MAAGGFIGSAFDISDRLPLVVPPNLEFIFDGALDAASVVVNGQVNFVELNRCSEVDLQPVDIVGRFVAGPAVSWGRQKVRLTVDR